MAVPGEYSAVLSKEMEGKITELSRPVIFSVERLYKGALKGSDPVETVKFWEEIAQLQRSTTAASISLKNADKKINALRTAADRTAHDLTATVNEIHRIKQEIFDLDEMLNGNKSKNEIGEKSDPTILSRLEVAVSGTEYTTYGPTPTHKKSLAIAKNLFKQFKNNLDKIINIEIPRIEDALANAGAPFVE
jgi:chromosome segregation ATPase